MLEDNQKNWVFVVFLIGFYEGFDGGFIEFCGGFVSVVGVLYGLYIFLLFPRRVLLVLI